MQSKWWLKRWSVYSVQDEIVGRRSASSSSVATSLMDDTSPESALGKKSESNHTLTAMYSWVFTFLLLFIKKVLKPWFNQSMGSFPLSCFISPLFLSSMNTSPPHVPAHFLYTSAREASDPSEETLHREGNPDQCPTIYAAHQTELQVPGESDISWNTEHPH